MENYTPDPQRLGNIDDVIQQIDELEKKIIEVNEHVITIQVQLKGAENISAFTEAIERQKKAIEDLQETTGEAQNITTKYSQQQVQAALQAAGAASALNQLQRQLEELTRQWEANGRASGVAAQKIGEVKGQISELTAQMDLHSKSVKSAGDAIANLGSVMEGKKSVFNGFMDTLSSLATQFTEFGPEVGVAVQGLELLYNFFNKDSEAATMAKERLKEYKDEIHSLKELNATSDMNATINSDLLFDDLDRKLKIITSKKSSPAVKRKEYEELSSVIPQVLKNYSLEEIAAGKVTEQLEKQLHTYAELIAKRQELQKKIPLQIAVYEKDKEKSAEYHRQMHLPDEAYNDGVDGPLKNHQAEMESSEKELRKTEQQIDEMTLPSDHKEKIKPLADKSVVSNYKKLPHFTGEKDLINSSHDVRKEALTQQMNDQKAIANNEKEELEKRKDANADYHATLIKLADNEYDRTVQLNEQKIKESKKTQQELQSGQGNYSQGDRKALIEDEAKKQQAALDEEIAAYAKCMGEIYKITQDSQKKLDEIRKQGNDQWLKGEENTFDEEKEKELQNYLAQEQGLTDSLSQKKISIEDYNKQITALKEKEMTLLNHMEQDFDQKMLDSGKLTDDERKKFQDRIDELKQQLVDNKGKEPKGEKKNYDLTGGMFSEFNAGMQDMDQANDEQGTDPRDAFKKRIAGVLHFSEQAVEIYQQMYAAIKQIRDNQFAAEQQQLQIKMQQLQLTTQQQLQAIDATAGFQVTKDNEKAKVAAQTAAQENAIQQQQNNLALKKAKADKQSAESGVLMNTALSIMKIWAAYAELGPIGVGLAAAETAVVAAIGAVQYAAAASTPLPQFAEGGTTTTPYFIAGEAGAEIIAPPGKRPYWSLQAAVHHEPPGTEVIPVQKMLEHAQQHVAGGSYGHLSAMQSVYNNHVIATELARLYKGNKENTDDMVMAIYRAAGRPVKNTVVVDMKNALQRPGR